MPVVFMVAEKPMLAHSIAKILSNNGARDRKGWNGACPVIEYEGSFRGKPAHFKMTSTCGHVMDCDKEGENICFEVIDAIRHVIRLAPDDSNIFRAKFSAISAKDINEAMRNLGRPNVNESLSVDARQELDLRIGCAFTRFQTKFFHSKYGDLDSSLVSFGPCQTPTLGFCVARYDQIQSFKPESYWVLQVSASHEKSDLKLEWSRSRLFDKDACHLFADRVKNAKEVFITDVSSEKRYKGRPAALNTVELMRIASSGLGMAPSHCMSIAEQLYTQGFISYPRTETTQYPQNFDARSLVKELESDAVLGPLASLTLSSGLHAARKGCDVGDHPPITPMKCDSTRRLSGDQFRLFEYIVQHFLATVTADEDFFLSGRVVLVPGFTAILNWTSVDDSNDDTKLPADLTIGQKLKISDVKVIERETTAPDYLTESELISLMEQHGIGTDASIPVHINNICQRNYVTVSSSGRKLIPTRLEHNSLEVKADLRRGKKLKR
uniref:DNA topoisomerase n=1 Tax=Romanomermis culicivorax TaxID=13658 RepID=A0A915HKQ5_ROMCU